MRTKFWLDSSKYNYDFKLCELERPIHVDLIILHDIFAGERLPNHQDVPIRKERW